MPALTTVYFDGSISVTDANNAWTNDANAFNGNTTTFATGSGTGNPTGGALVGAGTSGSIGSGSIILSVRARLYGGGITTRTWGPWITLTAPTGGWTSANIKSLETRIYNYLAPSWTSRVKAMITTAGNAENLGTVEAGTDSDNAAEGASVGRVEIEVSTDTGERYLRATGNWNGPVWADTSGGVAGSAATPTANDSVYIAANYTVTLTADATALYVNQTRGTLNLSSFSLTVEWDLSSHGDAARSINLGSGHLVVGNSKDGADGYPASLYFTGSNLSFSAGSSLVTIYVTREAADGGKDFSTLSNVFNDVEVRLLSPFGGPSLLNITGSPTFRLLDIRSANSAAHTVNFDDVADIFLDKFIAIGSSASSRLKINGNYTTVHLQGNTWSTYGQFVDISIDPSGSGAGSSAYIGSNSIGSGAWVFADPPKTSTLVDPLTTAPGSNPNWTVTGTVTQVTTGHDGGGYSGGTLTSADTLDLVGSEVVFEVRNTGTGFANMQLSPTLPGARQAALPWLEVFSNSYDTGSTMVGLGGIFASFPHTNGYIKIGLSTGGVLSTRFSTDGATWSAAQTKSIDSDWLPHFRSNRISITSGNSGVIGSINPDMSPRVDLTYRFDGHNYITNTNDEWTNPSNAADGSLSTSANAYKAGGVMENVLILAGTVKESAPQVSDESIVSVKARIYGSAQGASGDVGASIYDGANYLAAAMKNGTTAGWGPYVTLPVPSGGWTVSKLNNLSARCFSMGGSDISAYVYRVELLVTAYELPPLLSTGNFLPFFLGGD